MSAISIFSSNTRCQHRCDARASFDSLSKITQLFSVMMPSLCSVWGKKKPKGVSRKVFVVVLCHDCCLKINSFTLLSGSSEQADNHTIFRAVSPQQQNNSSFFFDHGVFKKSGQKVDEINRTTNQIGCALRKSTLQALS